MLREGSSVSAEDIAADRTRQVDNQQCSLKENNPGFISKNTSASTSSIHQHYLFPFLLYLHIWGFHSFCRQREALRRAWVDVLKCNLHFCLLFSGCGCDHHSRRAAWTCYNQPASSSHRCFKLTRLSLRTLIQLPAENDAKIAWKCCQSFEHEGVEERVMWKWILINLVGSLELRLRCCQGWDQQGLSF